MDTPSNLVTLKITTDSWTSKPYREPKHSTNQIIVTVKCGEDFGPIIFEKKPFKLLKIIDSNSIEVEFIQELVIVGEPIAYLSKQNPKIISNEKVGFRTRIYDAGTDLWLEIVNIDI
ncbi:MAG: hypothetical protein ACFFBD_13250 [Candidatus Hodarchaeota archaeon]